MKRRLKKRAKEDEREGKTNGRETSRRAGLNGGKRKAKQGSSTRRVVREKDHARTNEDKKEYGEGGGGRGGEVR